MAEFRRRQNSDRWHWSKDCSNFPREKDAIISVSSKIVNHARNCTVWVVE